MSVKLPKEVIEAWKERESPLVLITVSADGVPNAIYASIVNILSDGRIAVVDNYFKKTKSNIEMNSKASALFISKNHKSYQIKGSIEYYNDGPIYNQMLTWADSKHPRKGVVVINAENVYRGAEQIA